MSVRTRFAPSPTGYLHIGGVRTALFNWLVSRNAGGQFLLRIDDTDQERNVDAALAPILHGFHWLGLQWDEGPEVGGPYAPYFQSQRGERYKEAVAELLKRGAAYRDFATPDELAAEREAAQAAGVPYRYSRKWMAETDAQAAAFQAEGRDGVVRLKMPTEGTLVLDDIVRGTVKFEWANEQDHVVQRPDGTCLYHLATVVDDYDFKITHVVRAEEHLPNTPRQVFIAQQLGYPLPAFAHLPYVAEPGSKNKLSKRKLDKYLKNRDFAALNARGEQIAKRLRLTTAAETFNPVIVDFYEQIGFLPDAILNYLVLLGWSLDDSTEEFTREEMIKHFSLERVNKSPASFDAQKLMAFQQRAMNALPIKQKVARSIEFLQRAGLIAEPTPCDMGEYVTAIVEAASDRITVFGDILEFDDFFTPDDELVFDEKAFEKRLASADDAVPLLMAFRDQLSAAESFDAASLEKLLHDFVEHQGIKIGQIIHALRVAVTGKGVGFGMFETLAILGRDRVLARIGRALALVNTP
jgi:glutamyl-tRNA synthetase